MKSLEFRIDPKNAVLGIWDGHDAGAALVAEGRLICAINEERLSKRKLEIGFPRRSIAAVLEYTGLRPGDIALVSASTTDFAKTLNRCFPSLGEEYYLLRRKKKLPGLFARFKKMSKYALTEVPPSSLTRIVTRWVLARRLAELGIKARLALVDHHLAHAAAAAFCSGFERAAVVTIDGIGDALSGSIWKFEGGKLAPIAMLSGRTSFGVFFEHVTNLLNMRELEDEGKVMALANFAYPIPDEENPLLSFISVEGTNVSFRYSSVRMYGELRKVLFRVPSEQFAFLAQRTLEVKLLQLMRNILVRTGEMNIALAGGVASNVKLNMLVRELADVKGFYVFPHMGDGGLAAGAALWTSAQSVGPVDSVLGDVLLGPDFSDEEVREALQVYPQFRVEHCADIADCVVGLLAAGEIVMWFQGRMEFGPRAMGARSILSLPDSLSIKDSLNLKLKRRVYYQPFCPSMLDEDAREILENYSGPPNRFMTCAYRVKPEKQQSVQGVINVDGSCRPQILDKDDSGLYYDLLCKMRKLRGLGVVLNTSFNLHGEPLVYSPADALRTFAETDVNYMALHSFLVTKSGGI